MTGELIVSIIPADGWRWYLAGEPEFGAPRPLTCFALVEKRYGDEGGAEREVEPVDIRTEALYGLIRSEWGWDDVVLLAPGEERDAWADHRAEAKVAAGDRPSEKASGPR